MQFRRVVKLREVFHVLLYAVSRFDEGCKKELAASCAGENGANDEQDVKEASQVSQVGQQIVPLPLVYTLDVACSQVNLHIFPLVTR